MTEGDRKVERFQNDSQSHTGIAFLGLFMSILIAFALYSSMWDYAMYCATLLVVLALGSKAISTGI